MAINWFKAAKSGYEKGYYDVEDLKKLVRKGRITQEEFKEICGQDYTE